jgi:uroporphyrinogen-III synthase
MTARSLAGKRIVITRPPHKADAFADRLRELGAEPVLLPTITIQPPTDPAPLDDALKHLDRYDWLILTSANAVTTIGQRLTALSLDPVWPAVAVIGPATGKALQEAYGITSAVMPEKHVAEALFAALRDQTDLSGARVLLPQGDLARPALADLLRGVGAEVDSVIAYENVRPEIDPALLADPVDAVTFTSSSTVQNFVDLFGDPLSVIGTARIACIGPVTADTARELGLPVHIVAEPHTLDGLIDALVMYLDQHIASEG